MNVVISSGHGLHVRGASGYIDEVNEARRVVEAVADLLRNQDVEVTTYHDDISTSQDENLQRIVDFHNSKSRDLDISVHFNAYVETHKPMGTEVLHVTQSTLAGQLSAAIADCGFINRGAKKRTDLYFLNNTEGPAILIEVCFVDSETDTTIYEDHFNDICEAIADTLTESDEELPDVTFHVAGKCSSFGGPNDMGVSESEGLAFIYDVTDQPCLFLPYQPEDTTGLARRLNPYIHYVACRWNYNIHPKPALLNDVALVRSLKTGIALRAFPADWGPHESTGRVADISPGLMDDLGITTDDEVEVIFPYVED